MTREGIQLNGGIVRLTKSVLGIAAILAFAFKLTLPSAAERAHAIPAPALDEPMGQTVSETAVLAGGCF